MMLMSSCSAGLPVQREAQYAMESAAVPYSIVCIIHGDGDYLYHDTSGNEYLADEKVLAGVKTVAERNPDAEVFIFHQRPRSHFLFFFPVHDGEFYYYRNGRFVAHELYWRDQRQSHLDPESELYSRFRADNQREQVSMCLYCGHEIPEFGGAGYDESYPDRTFTVRDLADGLKHFVRDSARFDLMVLSTCFGGTPYTVGALGLCARYIIASPENLHLSYFDLHALERMDVGVRDGDVHAFAKRFAHQAFDRLTGEVQTAVSVAVYDADRTQEFLHSIHGVYDQTLAAMEGETPASRAVMGHCDCTDLSAYVLPTISEGVEILYRPAQFGRSKYKINHSGWECWNESGPQVATSRINTQAPK